MWGGGGGSPIGRGPIMVEKLRGGGVGTGLWQSMGSAFNWDVALFIILNFAIPSQSITLNFLSIVLKNLTEVKSPAPSLLIAIM